MITSILNTLCFDLNRNFYFIEVFPTCADLYHFMMGKRFESEHMLKSNRDYTVDPDGPEGVKPFVVSCQFPMTVVKIGPSQCFECFF